MKGKHAVLILILSVIVACGVAYVLLVPRSPDRATMLLINGKVYTVYEEQPRAEAIAVNGKIIVGVGSTEEIARRYAADTVIDLGGRTVLPGFIDAHAHLESLGAYLLNLDLLNAASVSEIQDRVRSRIGSIHAGGWLRGRGWDQNKWRRKEFPSRHDLDPVSEDVPVYLVRVDGHALWVNSRALQIAGITKGTPDPEGGMILREPDGSPTGILIDNAMELLASALPPPNRQERIEAIDTAVQECLSVGLTEVHDMGVDLEGISIYDELIRSGKFPFRVYAAMNGDAETLDHYFAAGPDIGGHQNRLTVRAIKLYADGALGSRGAALVEPYSDDKQNRGLTLMKSSVMQSIAEKALERGFQVCTHAIGDRGNHIVLNCYENAFNSRHINGFNVRFRVEHAQVLLPEDIARFGILGVIPSMQPTHCTSDMPWATDRLGPERVKGAYAWRSLLEHGSIIPGGSDFPVESPNPLLGFYAAITRQDITGKPDGGWHPQEKMTREEALRSFTVWAAYASFQDSIKGSLQPGKVADLVVLSDDIMQIAPLRIPQTNVDITMIDGEIVFSSGEVQPKKMISQSSH